MKKIRNITIIGTSHIARQSIDEIRKIADSLDPDMIAVELDPIRLNALLDKNKKKSVSLLDIKKVGLNGFIFSIIGRYVQKKLGRIVNIDPGADMLEAVNIAKEKKKKLVLIDQRIDITLKKFSRAFGWKEKWNLIIDIFKGLFFRKKEMKKLGLNEIDLTKVPSEKIIKKMIKNVKKRYPSLYRVLIKERNDVMAHNLIQISVANPEKKILAVIGAGHEEDIYNMIKEK